MTLPFPTSDLNMLQDNLSRIQESLTTVKLGQFTTTLEQIESSISKIQTDRRKLIWVKRGSEILRYLGYIAMEIISYHIRLPYRDIQMYN